MANPNINTLTDIFLPDGFGAFGYGDGVYGGYSELLNPQWNTNSGNFGIDTITGLPYVEATSTPSYVGASLYTIEYSSFFAKIVPATIGGGSVQTALVIKHDAHNYVEMSIGPDGQFKAYVSNDLNVTLSNPVLPNYDPTAHAYWRIRNDNRLVFRFDTSPDGFTWTEQGSVPYTWDASSVVVTFFAGFTGIDSYGNLALISRINLPGNILTLSSSGSATAGAGGQINLSDPNALSANANAKAIVRASFGTTSVIPEGGLTDFSFVPTNIRTIDPLITTTWNGAAVASFTGSSPVTQAHWTNAAFPNTVPTPYRDGSYFPSAAYADIQYNVGFVPDTAPTLFTNAQVEQTSGLDNRLSINASIYTDSCCYAPGTGVTSIVRSTDLALSGQYSGKIISNSSVGTLGDGSLGYWILPQFTALSKVKKDSFGASENLFGSVYLSTSRANTVWFASFMFYDANFNLLSGSTYQHATITNKNTHPGGNVWQPGNIYQTLVPGTAAYVAICPVIIVSGGFTGETVYTSNHSITGASLFSTETFTPYIHPKTADINIKADRINYVINSGFNINTFGWVATTTGTTGSPSPNSITWDSATGYKSLGSMRVDVAVPSGTFAGSPGAKIGTATRKVLISTGSSRVPPVQGLKIGHTYTISMWIKQSANCPNVYMNFADANNLGPVDIDLNTIEVSMPDNIDGNWTRLQTTYTVPPTGLQDYSFFVYTLFSDIVQAPYSFWVDSIIVEESNTYNGYFDGGFASIDYMWESGGAPNACRSYYYKNYVDKFLDLSNSISSVLPIGEYYNLQFALPIQ